MRENIGGGARGPGARGGDGQRPFSDRDRPRVGTTTGWGRAPNAPPAPSPPTGISPVYYEDLTPEERAALAVRNVAGTVAVVSPLIMFIIIYFEALAS